VNIRMTIRVTIRARNYFATTRAISRHLFE
jgi:hypothetical protein